MLLVLLALSYVPRAYAADDAPLADVVLVPAAQRVREGKAMAACEARSERLEAAVTASTPLPPLVVVGLVVLGVVVGGAATYGVIRATGAK